MDPWIALERGVFDHRKTLRLSIRLGLRETHLVGHLSRLWTWSLASAPTGELVGVESEVIARAADWTGDLLEVAAADAFVGALIDVGFLDQRDGGLLVLHGWRERHEQWADRREAELASAEQREEDRKRKHAKHQADYRARQKGERPGDVSGDRAGEHGEITRNDHADHPVNGVTSPVANDVIGRDVTRLARPDRTGPDRTSPDITGDHVPLSPPQAGGSPPGPPAARRGARTAMTAREAFGDETAPVDSPQGEARRLVLAWARDALLGETRLSWPDFAAELGRADLAAAPERAVAQWIERVRRELEATGELDAARERAANSAEVTGDVTHDATGEGPRGGAVRRTGGAE